MELYGAWKIRRVCVCAVIVSECWPQVKMPFLDRAMIECGANIDDIALKPIR